VIEALLGITICSVPEMVGTRKCFRVKKACLARRKRRSRPDSEKALEQEFNLHRSGKMPTARQIEERA